MATGIPGLITADMIKPGATVIDIGINRVKDEKTGKYKIVGDVDFEGKSCSKGMQTLFKHRVLTFKPVTGDISGYGEVCRRL